MAKAAAKATKKSIVKATMKPDKKPAKTPAKKAAPKSSQKGAGGKGETAGPYRLNPGDRAPSFELQATSGKTLSLDGLKGQNFVLYFYPKDNTPGCTLEGQDFKRLYKGFKAAGCEVIGVSKDSLKSHENFREKCGFPFELISDSEETLCRKFDVIQMKSLYGRKFEGIERSTFVIGADGRVRGAWRKVKVADHAREVLDFAKNMAKNTTRDAK